MPSKEKQRAVATGIENAKNLAQNLALLDGKPRTSMDSDGQKPKRQVYSGKWKKMLFKAKDAIFAAKKQAQKIIVGNSVMVARLTLNQLVQVRILVPQVVSINSEPIIFCRPILVEVTLWRSCKSC